MWLGYHFYSGLFVCIKMLLFGLIDLVISVVNLMLKLYKPLKFNILHGKGIELLKCKGVL